MAVTSRETVEVAVLDEVLQQTLATALLGQAEKIAMDETAAFPIYWYIAQNVVSPKITGMPPSCSDTRRNRSTVGFSFSTIVSTV